VETVAPVLVIVVLAVVVMLVSAPLRARTSAGAEDRDAERRADLEAAKEDKYREIREAELDFRTAKFSEADWRALDRELRGEAMEILHRLDALGPRGEGPDRYP